MLNGATYSLQRLPLYFCLAVKLLLRVITKIPLWGILTRFFHELHHSYAYSDYRFEQNRSLHEIENILRPRIVAKPTWENLVVILTDLLDKYIADPHLYTVYSPMEVFSNNEHLELRRNNKAELIDWGTPALKNRILSVSPGGAQFRLLSTDNTKPIRYAIIEINSRRIGYIYVDSVTYDGGDDAGGTERLVNPGKIFEELTDKIVADLVSKNATQVILDIRSSAGGAPYNGARIAARFINKRKKYMISKTTVQFGKEQVQMNILSLQGIGL